MGIKVLKKFACSTLYTIRRYTRIESIDASTCRIYLYLLGKYSIAPKSRFYIRIFQNTKSNFSTVNLFFNTESLARSRGTYLKLCCVRRNRERSISSAPSMEALRGRGRENVMYFGYIVFVLRFERSFVLTIAVADQFSVFVFYR